MSKKYQIFVSSTYLDLKEERQESIQAILESKNIPAGMELFTAQNVEQWEVIKKWIDDSDIVVLLLGGRYGSIDETTQKSYTHMEYEYAKGCNKPLIVLNFTKEYLEDAKDEDILELTDENLINFKDEVMQKMVKEISDFKDIKSVIQNTLLEMEKDDKIILSGWVRGDICDNTPQHAIGETTFNEMKDALKLREIQIDGDKWNGLEFFENIIINRGGTFNGKFDKSLPGGSGNTRIFWDNIQYYISLNLLKKEEMKTTGSKKHYETKFTNDGQKFIQLLEKSKLYD